jgi:hypothetical protein
MTPWNSKLKRRKEGKEGRRGVRRLLDDLSCECRYRSSISWFSFAFFIVSPL